MKKGWFKWAATGLAVVVVGTMISAGITAKINEKKDSETTDTSTQACIECVIDA